MTRIRPSFHSARPGLTPKKPVLPACPICNKEVLLETAKTDADGRALHEDCYLLKLNRKQSTTPTGGVGLRKSRRIREALKMLYDLLEEYAPSRRYGLCDLHFDHAYSRKPYPCRKLCGARRSEERRVGKKGRARAPPNH